MCACDSKHIYSCNLVFHNNIQVYVGGGKRDYWRDWFRRLFWRLDNVGGEKEILSLQNFFRI